MRIADHSHPQLQHLLANSGLVFKTGPFVIRLQSRIPSVTENLALIYAGYEVCDDDVFADFHVRLSRSSGLRRWVHPQVLFRFDGKTPFKPLPLSQAFAMMEWGLNWCVSNHAHQYLILHAAVIEKNGQAIIMPARPGSGKSTLTAGLVCRGWRLLSDELALVRRDTLAAVPLARPVNLKNESIQIIKDFSPATVFTHDFHDTSKGTVALMQAPQPSISQSGQEAMPAYLVEPCYRAGSATRFFPQDRGSMFMHVADNAFNYSLQGRVGFQLLGQLIDQVQCYRFEYSDLDEAVEAFDTLVQTGRPA